MKQRRRIGWAWTLAPLALIAVVLLQAYDPGRVISTLQAQVFDSYQRAKPRDFADTAAAAGTPVRIIDVDEESLKRLGQWPWPRSALADMVERIDQAGARVIAFDVVFSEPDRTGPESLLRALPGDVPEETRAAIAALPDPDATLAQAMERATVVAGTILTAGPSAGAPPAPRTGLAILGSIDPLPLLPSFSGAVTNLPAIDAAADGVGALNVLPDRDGVVRRVPMLLRAGEAVLPGLAAEALRLAGPRPNLAVKTAGGGGEQSYFGSGGIVAIQSGGHTIETTAEGELWVHYTAPTALRRMPAWQVFEAGTDLSALRDAIVLVGSSAAGLRDIRATPMQLDAPGVDIHAQAIEQVLTGHFLQRPDFALGAEIVYAIVIGGIVLILIRAVPAIWTGAVAFGGAAAAGLISWHLFDTRLWLVDPLMPAAAALVVFAAAAFARFLDTDAERSFIRSAFGQYLSPAVVDQIARHPERLKLAGETRPLTVMFCDIRGFTPIAESLKDDPQTLTALVNRVLTPLTHIVLAHGGTIDKYMGDCIMAFWNAPLDEPDHALRACECALKMTEALEALNAELAEESRLAGREMAPIAIGIGLATGDCVVGNMGSDIRFDYTAMGDTVNLAARIQALSGSYGPAVVVAEATRDPVERRFAFLEVDLVRVKGRSAPARIFALLGNPVTRASPKFKALQTFHAHIFAAYRAGDWARAKALIAECRTLSGASPEIYDLYERRIAHFQKDPPPTDWDGATPAGL